VRWILPLASLLFIASVIGVLWASLAGVEIKGAQRWIRLMGFSLQPSEFLKPSVVVLAGFLLAQARLKEKFRFVVFASALVIFAVACLISQPDFGMSALIVFIFCVQLFLYGISLRYVFVLSAGVFVLAGLAYISFDHVSSRIDRFLSPETADTFQVDRSLDSFAQGGAIGVGPGQGEVKMSLPDAHADFIFSVAGEEFGFILTSIILSLYALILWLAFRRLSNSPSLFCVYAGGGLAALIFMQAFIHAGSAMSLLPAKGMTMPYVSYGGSSTLAIGATFGWLLSLLRIQR
jgi:cell division protein FtsW